jgi:PAS domain S-box-containing protein
MYEKSSLDQWLEGAVRRLTDLEGAGDGDGRVREAVDHLSASLDELRAADEQIQQQVVQLAAARGASETQRRRYQDLFESAPFGYITTDMDAAITEVNRAAAGLLRREPRSLIGTALAAHIAQPDRRLFRRRLCELLENPESGEWQTRIIPCGSLITISVGLAVQVVPGANGEASSLRWVMRDLRELRRAQSEAMAREEARYSSARRAQHLEEENRLLRTRLDDRAARSGNGRSRPD